MKKPELPVDIMDQSFFNRILHLVDARPKEGKRMIGLGRTALWELWQRVNEMVREERQQRMNDSVRKRQAGGGRKKEAEVLCRLLVTLLYLRQHWTMKALAETIGCAESTVWNYIHEMLPYLRKGLPASLLEQWQQECDSIERAELEEWLASLPEGELLVDTWEQPIPRPQDNDKQKAHYSGKKGNHTFKNQLISLPKGRDIVDVVIGEKGPRSDSKLFEETQTELPEALKFIGDKAYVGRRNTTTPLKKPIPMKPIDLIDHPEGGRFREVFRSPQTIVTPGGDTRSALTHIYFALNPGEVSRFHRVSSDEVWNLYQGTGLHLYTWDGTVKPPTCVTLSAESNCYCHVIPAGMWQAAEPIAETVLVGCSVAPGFDFADFELIEADSDLANLVQSIDPALSKFARSNP